MKDSNSSVEELINQLELQCEYVAIGEYYIDLLAFLSENMRDRQFMKLLPKLAKWNREYRASYEEKFIERKMQEEAEKMLNENNHEYGG